MKLASKVNDKTALDLDKMAEKSPALKQILVHTKVGFTPFMTSKDEVVEPEEVVRVQLDLPQSRIETLKGLMHDLGIATRKDLFNNALTLLAWVTNEKKKGNVIISLNEGNASQKELVMLPLENVATNAKINSGGGGQEPPSELGGNDDDSEEEKD